MPRMLRAALAVAAVAVVPPGAAAAGPPRLAGTPLTVAPATVARGEQVTVSGEVVNPGRRDRRVRVRVLLAQRGDDVVLARLRLWLPAGGRRAFTATAAVPPRATPGRRAVRACVRSSCRTARQRLLVTAPVDQGPVAPTPVQPASPAPGPSPEPAPQPPPAGPTFSPGARSGGDVLFPQIGNGGYDARHYDLSFDYDAADGTIAGVTTMTAVATQNLSQLSMDLQGFDVSAVQVGAAGDPGTPAASVSRELPAAASPNAESIASKLVITPRYPIEAGARFAVTVRYAGEPQTVIDPDGSSEGWFPTDTGGVVVCQPIGCQGVYPSNNVPYDKATFATAITVPEGLTGLGVGELEGTSTAGGRTTWRWRMQQPISTYLTTATIGDYDLRQSTATDGTPIHDAVDRDFGPADRAHIDEQLGAQEAKVEFLEGIFGPYPFGSYGAIVADAPDLGYALEVATKPVYPASWAWSDGSTFTHELLHQWIGNSVTYGQIRDMWIHEGTATWIEWHWGHEEDGGPSPADLLDELYDDPRVDWSYALAEPTGETLFTVYARGAMMLEALRQLVGDGAYFRLLRRMADRFRHGTITTAQFTALAEEVSGRDLGAFFDAWLFTAARPPAPVP